MQFCNLDISSTLRRFGQVGNACDRNLPKWLLYLRLLNHEQIKCFLFVKDIYIILLVMPEDTVLAI